MPSIDMSHEQLRQYKPSLYREEDFEAFWNQTVREALQQPLHAELIPFNLPTKNLECYALRFEGFGGGRIAGWYMRPSSRGKFPGLCMYHGYSGRGTRPMDMVAIASQGVCVLSMDCRGQNGQSQDAAVTPEGQHSGWMTKGIRDPNQYYYRYVYADAVRAIELLARRGEVDDTRLAITGGSQGGALTLAVAALSERPALALADVPFLCDFRRAVAITPAGPYPEIAQFLRSFPMQHDQVFRTLSYFDCMNLAPWITCKTIISNSLWDDICPPSTIFAAYHHMTTTDKHMEIHPFHKHDVPYEHSEVKHRAMMEMFLK
ncbi:MAG: alpha/beta fold hydrolase [Anaerolineae bacterium]|nr:alpha/beta fold hydrolase [Phycisphaerae bacterium]